MTSFPGNLTVEFPTLHPRYVGKRGQYGFAGGLTEKGMNSIVKFDLFNMRSEVLYLPADMLCGEPVVIPKLGRAGRASDGVYLASFAVNITSNASEWIVYDGYTMNPTPVLRLGLSGCRVPFGFHGLFLSEQDLQRHLALP
jgi:carotenoid cleavage dioxygenase-like enzyme